MAERGIDDDNLPSLQSMKNSQLEDEDLKEPSLAREIGKVAWLFAKAAGAILAVVAVFIPIFRWSLVAGMLTFYGVIFAGIIAQVGYSNYKWKTNEWKRKRQEETARRDEASKHLSDDKTA